MDYNINLELKEEEKLAAEICDDIRTAEEERKSLVDKLQKCYENFEGTSTPKSYPWKDCSNVFIPITAISVEALHARLIASILGSKPIFLVKERRAMDLDKKDRVEGFLDYMATDQVNLFDTLDNWLLLGLIQGTGVLKCIWNDDKRKIYRLDENDDMQPAFEKLNKPKFFPIDLNDFIIPSKSKDIQSAPFVAHRLRYRFQDLLEKEKQNIYYNVNKLKSQDDETESADYNKYKDSQVGINEQRYSNKKDGYLYIYEVYKKYDFDKDGYDEECIFTVSYKERKIIRAIINPYISQKRPFISFQTLRRPNNFYGIGIPESIGGLQEQLNTLYNQRNDSVSMVVAKIFKANKGTIDPTQKEIYPGAIIDVDSMDDLQPLITGDVAVSAYQEEPIVKDYIEKRTGVTDFALGQQKKMGTGRGTATGTLALIQEGNTRFDLIIKRVNQAMNELAKNMIELCYQYFPKETQFKVTKDNKDVFLNITKEDLNLDADYQVQGTSSSSNKAIESQQLLNAYQMLTPNPLVANNPQRLYYLTKKVLLSMGYKDYDKIIGSAEEMQKLMQQLSQAMAQQGQQGQQPQGQPPQGQPPAMPQS